MMLPRFSVWIFSVGMMVLAAGVVSGQAYPNKPIRIVAPEAGGGGDFAARLIALGLSGSLGQQVIVENRGGASGIIAGRTVAKAPPDGYTLLFYGSIFWIGALLQDVPYDPVADFSPITLATSSPNILVVHPSLPVNSVKELIALAKARPGELNYASTTGSTPHLAAELFKAMAGVNIVRIPYKGAGPALNDLIGGQVQLMFPVAAAVTPHVKSGRLRALAVTSVEPSELVRGLPTVAATVPGYESVQMTAMFAPAKTPATIINRLNQEIVQVLNRADVKEKFFNAGAKVVGGSPEQLMATMKSEMARLGKVIKDAGIRAE
ncbi:MAG: tripartite tricarboxylate transporter substrate binding protein [Betaproteobacteria bacterium]|nr:tripartite tricarboxylate transporter substrate binding protein [Betaproteobacteria bacterium]